MIVSGFVNKNSDSSWDKCGNWSRVLGEVVDRFKVKLHIPYVYVR